MDLVPILNREARALQAAGATVIQFDEPSILKHKEDIDLFAEAIQGVTDGITATTGVSTIFGDASGVHERLFGLPVDIVGLDFVMGPGNFDLIRDLPQDKMLGCGIVDARNTRLESVEEVAYSIVRINRSVPFDRLHVNPSCGLDFLPRPNARAKLARLVEGARKAQEDFS